MNISPTPSEIPETENLDETKKKTQLQEIIEFIRDIIIIFLVVILIRSYGISPFRISGSSMEESYHDDEYILVDKFSYASELGVKIGDPKRGDVVILRPHAKNGKEYYIKRVIGLPGDTVKFQDGEIYLKKAGASEAVKLDETYLSANNRGRTYLPGDVSEDTFTVPLGEYFVMGDNRNNSSDSRSCFMTCSMTGSTHYIKREDVVGKVFIDFGHLSLFDISADGVVKIAKNLGWSQKPRFFDTPREWTYPELANTK